MAGGTERISIALDGGPPNGASQNASITPDGRFVVFTSQATNLTADARPGTFIRDRQTQTTAWLGAGIDIPSVSRDGRRVLVGTGAFENRSFEVLDRASGVRTAVPAVVTTGIQLSGGSARVLGARLSADGGHVAYFSDVQQFSGITSPAGLFVFDVSTHGVCRVPLPDPASGIGPFPSGGLAGHLAISANGQIVFFLASIDVPGTGPRGLYESHCASQTTTRIVAQQLDSGSLAATPDARHVMVGLFNDFLLFDRQSGTFRQFRMNASGFFTALSDDAAFFATNVTFSHFAPGSVWVVNTLQNLQGITSLDGSAFDAGQGSALPRFGSTGVEPSALSSDGRYLAISTGEPSLIPGTPAAGPAGLNNDIVVRDLRDVDEDGIPTFWETAFELDPYDPVDATHDEDNDGRTNLEEYLSATHPDGIPSATRYFAEGATSEFFHTNVAVVNPTASEAHLLFRFETASGDVVSLPARVGPMARLTVTANDIAGLDHGEFSTTIESDVAAVIDRTMSWDAAAYGSHAETSIISPATTWFLAEGATHSGFDLFYLLLNPGAQTVNVHVKYLLPAGAPIEKDYVLGPHARFNIWVDVDDPVLANTDVSAVVTSNRPIIVERAMYLSSSGKLFNAGHESAGVTAPATEWFLAEGATGDFFDLFILIANPSPADAQVQATFLLPDGDTVVKSYTVGADSRANIWVDGEDAKLVNTAVSTIVTSLNVVPIVVERTMWWPGPTAASWSEAHNSAGLTATGTKWALAEGEVGGPRGIETYILIANRGATDVAAVTLIYEDGGQETKTFVLNANSRTNVAVAAEFPNSAGRRFGAIVEAANPSTQIVVERAMYSNSGGVVWAAGTNAVATKLQ